MNKPSKIILHCADTPDSGDQFGLEHINRWHKENEWQPWVGSEGKEIHCGYHYVIRRSGAVEIGRPENVRGVHCRGHNQDSIGVCYMGTRRMTEMQVESFLKLYSAIYGRHKIEPSEVYGHYEFNEQKTCPGQDMIVIRKLLKLYRGIK